MNFHGLPQDEVIAYDTMACFAKHVHIPGIHCIGSGLAEDKTNHKIGVLDICFSYDDVLTIEIGRKLTVQLMEQFVNYINHNQKLSPYLSVSPVTPKQVSISISGRNTNELNDIRSVLAYRGTINYYNNVLGPPAFGLTYKETYEEAVSKLKTP